MGRESIVNVCLTLEVLENNQPNNTPPCLFSKPNPYSSQQQTNVTVVALYIKTK